MIRFIADENFDGKIINGLRAKHPHVDLITAQEAGLAATPDPEILEWAVQADRVVLSRDTSTMKGYAEARVRVRLPLTGLLLTNDRMSRGSVIDQIEQWSRKTPDRAFAYPVQYITPN